MRRTWTLILGAALLLALPGCAPGNQSGTASPQQSNQQTPATFDDLSNATRLEMITKPTSDLPKNWVFQDQEAKDKAAILVPVLKSAAKMDIKDPVKSAPVVTFVADTPNGKRIVNLFEDRFEYHGTWYQLDNAPEKTYGPIKPK
ncbi:hypothetical protein [Tumebacillus flagellatus]|uniref:Lipoprotein n=1 Tax=Tumebacillus flagellatus TaxID=1157490 RepID=A0A074LSV9_9BACL|nr:hypothetical protein [Tumebacillus flagellatus]KEO82913.1 hypothetical protein EL26_12515 [Tumebacillus flagellatus]